MRQKIHSIAIVAGGTSPEAFVFDIGSKDLIIGVDRGALWLVQHGIVPDIAIGDFDSVSKVEKSRVKNNAKRVYEYLPKKDATDLELAIDKAIGFRPEYVTIYGGIGSRFDHSWAAVQMLLKLESHNILGQIVDNFNKISVVRRQMIFKKRNALRYVSVLPLESSATITLEGFVYDVSHKHMKLTSTLGVSNEVCRQSASITVHKGCVLVIQSVDEVVR